MDNTTAVRLTINGREVEAQTRSDAYLMDFLRDKLGLVGVKNGCKKGHCGACTVILNGEAVRSCIVRMARINGGDIETIENLEHDGKVHPLQYTFIQENAVQCGFCTPGMILSAKALLDRDLSPSDSEVRRALKNNLCRCTGYASILRAVQHAAALLRSGQSEISLEFPNPELPDGSLLGAKVLSKRLEKSVTGKLAYGDDLSIPGMLHGKVRWSDYPSAEIRKVDIEAALQIPGVRLILTGKDVPGVNHLGILRRDQPALCTDRVRCISDPVAVVFADSEEFAAEAVRTIQVDYNILPGVFLPEDALASDAPLVHPSGNVCHAAELKRGDMEFAFSEAAIIIENTYTTPFIEHAFMEPECGLSWPTEDGGVSIQIGTQCAFDDRSQLAEALALPEEKIRIVQLPMGGAFGGKEDIILHFFLGLGAMRLQKPVKMVLSREESLRTHPKRHAVQMYYKTAASQDGHLLAVQSEIVADTGAYASLGPDIIENMLTFGAGPYYVPNVELIAKAVYTNNIPGGAMRGFGVPQVAFAMEAQMDDMARALGIDPFEFRRQNALDVGLSLPSDHILESSVGIKATLDAAEQALRNNPIVAARTEAAYNNGKKIGIGVASSLKNIGFGHGATEEAGAHAELLEDGSIRIRVGVADFGQGSHTVMTQLAAIELGVTFEQVDISYTDTAVSPYTGPTTASRQTFLSGNAVVQACRQLKEEIFRVAEEELRLSAKDFTIRSGRLVHTPSGETFGLNMLGSHLKADARYTAPNTAPFREGLSNFGEPDFQSLRTHYAYSFATHVAIVTVDEITGAVEVLAVIAAHDVGRAINPLMINGQIEGGVMMGVGYGLSEEFIIKEGYNVTDSLHRCHLPNIEDAPEIIPIIVEDPHPDGPYGAKGVAEVSLLPTAAAIANAIFDATGARITMLPANKKCVLETLKNARGS